VLSPGFTNSRSTLTALAEDLASHGYVVAGIDHTYESHGTAFPDGRVTTCLARKAPRRDRKEEVAAGRAADVCFVLDELTGAHPAWPGAALIDPSRMAMAGHSAGGAAAIAAMLARPPHPCGHRHGQLHCRTDPGRGPGTAVSVPGQAIRLHPGSGGAVTTLRDWKLLRGAVITWERDWELLTGWKRWLVVTGAVHASFTDLALLADQVGIDIGAGLSGAQPRDQQPRPAASPVPLITFRSLTAAMRAALDEDRWLCDQHEPHWLRPTGGLWSGTACKPCTAATPPPGRIRAPPNGKPSRH